MKLTQNITAYKGFDRITFIYDAIARIASFNWINKSQHSFLSVLSSQSTCLILGGGTGYFLQRLLEQNKIIHIVYVDASQKMIEYAHKRIAKKLPDELHRVVFLCKDVEVFEFNTYDVIVCNYFLDLFEETYVDRLVGKFKNSLNKEGLLYITDFTIPASNSIIKWSTKKGLKILYWFFKWTTSLSNNRLADIESIVLKHNFVRLQNKYFLNGILKCSVYR